MALVRVYCGLASADPAARPASSGSVLVAAVVDDAGRLLDVCAISDDPAGYAQLGALLAERQGGLSSAAIATDSDDHLVVSLLSAAGRPIAVTDDDSVDDFAERFADDESLEEMEAAPTERRAVGMARALQAGALSAVALPESRDLAGYKSVLAAHAALVNGRHAAAVALREVLRGLYPAALRAYPDPADPVSLAVLNALPEPGMLIAEGTHARDTTATADAVTADLVADGVGDRDTIDGAVTALRLAISETHRRGPATRALASASAQTVRQAIAAVRAYDTGSDVLVAVLAARVAPAKPATTRRPVRRSATAPISAPPSSAGRAVRSGDVEATPAAGRRSRVQPTTAGSAPTAPHPVTAPPIAPSPVAPPPVAPPPVAPPPAKRAATEPAPSLSRSAPAPYRPDAPANRPVSVPPPPPPGITPIVPGERTVPPAEAGEPFRATLTTAAINSARAERQRSNQSTTAQPKARSESTSAGGFDPTDYSIPVPTPRPKADSAPPGSRANWPLVNSSDDRAGGADGPESTYSFDAHTPADPPSADGRIAPPWLAEDLPPEPPMLRLVEPSLANRGRNERSDDHRHVSMPSLRLIDSDATDRRESAARPRPGAADQAQLGSPAMSDEDDGDLLIFAAARSAWFSGDPEESNLEWTSQADSGWQAAEQAARPAVGEATTAGLPRRVPKANLVPGSPLREDRPLRIIRDAARIAENTTGYFRGWRRGQEIGGYAVGGRPGRESAGGWDFSRDHDTDHEEHSEYEYRSARY